MRVLGIDPGLTRCGLGVVDTGAGRSIGLVAVDVARTGASVPLPERLVMIADTMALWMERYQPDAVAVEQVFAQRNKMTVTGTAQVLGLALVEATRRHIPAGTHTPTEVKAAVTGSGRADKEQVRYMVGRLLRLKDPPKVADATDALALAICHAWRPGAGGASRENATMTPAQRAWAQAEKTARRSGR